MNLRLRLELGMSRMVALQYLGGLALRLEQPILNLSRLNRSRTLVVIVLHMIDPRAHWIRAHQPRIERLQQIGHLTDIPHSRIEPNVVTVGIKDDWHSVVDGRRYSAVQKSICQENVRRICSGIQSSRF